MSQLDRVLAWNQWVPWMVGVAAAVAVCLHYVGLTRVPPGFFVDEAGIAYAAAGISLDGHDEHGAAWPLYFESFGDWKNPILIYLVALVIRLFGFSVGAVRAVPSTLSLLTAVLLGLLVWRLFGLRWLAAGTALVASVTPWLFTVGRVVFEVSALPTLLALFLMLWLWAGRKAGPGAVLAAGLAGAVLGLATYAYSTARLYVPLLLVALVAAELSPRRWRLIVPTVLATCLVEVPLLLFNRAHPGALLARYHLISVFNDSHSPAESLERVWRVYTSGFSPELLFLANRWYGGGEFFPILAIPLAVGLIALWRRRRDPFFRFAGLALLLAPVPAALTYDFGHDLRNLEAVPFYAVTMAAGMAELAPLLARQRALSAALVGLLGFQAVYFLSDYFIRTPTRMAGAYSVGMERAVHDTMRASAGGPVAISGDVFGGDIFYAFYGGEDVRAYRVRGIAALDAQVVDPAAQQPSGTVLLTTGNDRPPHARLLERITLSYPDDWGRLQEQVPYLIWRSVA